MLPLVLTALDCCACLLTRPQDKYAPKYESKYDDKYAKYEVS
jgi:hypothetical protein